MKRAAKGRLAAFVPPEPVDELAFDASPAILRRLVAGMVARVLHPGHAGPLGGSLPGDPYLRRHGDRS